MDVELSREAQRIMPSISIYWGWDLSAYMRDGEPVEKQLGIIRDSA
jgi:hypothetical protein